MVSRLVRAVTLVKDVEIKWDWVEDVAMVEWRTRYYLIDPLLRALGWDTGDPQMCFIEWPIREIRGRVDYAFFEDGSTESIAAQTIPPVLLVEAKAKDKRLVRNVSGLERYVKAIQEPGEGVAVLTNGREWWIYDVSWGTPIDRSNREVIDVVNEPVEEVARRLEARLSPDNWFQP